MKKLITTGIVAAALAAGPVLFAGNASAASPQEDQAATANFNTTLATSMTVGGLAGTAAGAGIGCVVGLPAGGVGCIPGAITGAAIGGVVGTLAFGGGALAVAGADAVQTYQAAPGTTRWAETR